MPLYEYECEVCGHRFEAIQKFSDAPLEKCPNCGGAVRKLQAAPAFQFKGSGWYVTDYAKKDQPSGGKKDGGGQSASGGESKSEKTAEKGDTPAAKTDQAARKDTSAAPKAAESSKPEKASGG